MKQYPRKVYMYYYTYVHSKQVTCDSKCTIGCELLPRMIYMQIRVKISISYDCDIHNSFRTGLLLYGKMSRLFFDSAIFINYQQHFKTQRTNLPTLIPYFAPV